jgi:tRNA G10  N-methylase Trm11
MLNPVLAALMVRAAGFRGNAVLVDPACGVGTIPIEASFFDNAVCIGGDVNLESLEMFRNNIRYVHENDSFLKTERLHSFVWDFGYLPLKEDAVDFVVSDLPFGKRHSSYKSVRNLYVVFLKSIARILVPGGRACVLVTTKRGFLDELGKNESFCNISSRTIVITTLVAEMIMFSKKIPGRVP